MILRSPRERLLQTLLFEVVGILVAAPIYHCLSENETAESFALIAAISATMLIWTPIHNTLFDAFEFLSVRRVASSRPQLLRLCHAASHEVSSMVVSVPVILAMTAYDLLEALLLDIGLGIFYAAYAFIFHNLFDLWRPVGTISDN